MNTQPRHPKCRALPVELHPDIQFLPLYHGEGENQRFFCLWSFMWSNPLLCRFRQSWKIPQTQASKGFAAFRLAPSRIPPRHSQSRRTASIRRHRIIKAAAPLCGIAIKIPREIQRGICCLIGRQTAETLPDRLPLRRHRRGGPRRCGRVHRANRPSASCPDCGWSAWC